MKRKVVTVSDVNRYVARLLDEDYVLSDVWLSGEISNCKYHQSGHIYFTLKDQGGSIQAVMFAKDAKKLEIQLEEGLKVYGRCRISLYEKTGIYQAYVNEIEKQGKGTLYEAFEKLKKALHSEGLFDEQYKKALPTFPKAVGVITSETGAAVKDILQVARRRNPGIPVYIYPTHVQGPLAAREMMTAIECANRDQLVDVIILGRGGGSIEDLWAFNDEALARVIFQSGIPIVSAVGHEVDFTISDFVSDRRAATPSAAAEIVFPSQEEYAKRIERYKMNLHHDLIATIERSKRELSGLINRPVFAHKEKYFENMMLMVDQKVDTLESAYNRRLKESGMKLEHQLVKLHTLSPLTTLKRGYSLVTKEGSDELVTKSDSLEVGDHIKITLKEGYVMSTVNEKG